MTGFHSEHFGADPQTYKDQHRDAVEQERIEAFEERDGFPHLPSRSSSGLLSRSEQTGLASDLSSLAAPSAETPAAPELSLPDQLAADVDYMRGVLERLTAVGEHATRMDLYRVIYGIERRVLGR